MKITQLLLGCLFYFIIYSFNSSRLLGRFAPFFYINSSEQFLFVCIVKKIPDLKKFIYFENFENFNRYWISMEENFIIPKPSLGSQEVPQKNWPDQFHPFGVYWIQTNTHPNRQAKYIYSINSKFKCKHLKTIMTESMNHSVYISGISLIEIGLLGKGKTSDI